MNISPHHIQNVIRAYGQRVGRRSLAPIRSAGAAAIPDVISISPEAKRLQIAEKVVSEIVSRVRGEGTPANFSPEVVERLETELEDAMDVLHAGHASNGVKFRIIDDVQGERIKELSLEDSDRMLGHVFDIIAAQSPTERE